MHITHSPHQLESGRGSNLCPKKMTEGITFSIESLHELHTGSDATVIISTFESNCEYVTELGA